MVETQDYRMLVLSFLSCDLHDNQLFLVYLYPVGFWYTNQSLGAPDQAVPFDLVKGSCKTT